MTDDTPVDPKRITARFITGKPRHNVIYSAATSPDGRIYLGLSAEMDSAGINAQLIRYDPAKDRFEDIADLAKIVKEPAGSLRHPHSKIHTAICFGKGGKVYAVTHMTAPPAGEDFYHYWHVYNDPARNFPGGRLIIYDPATGHVEDFGVAAPRGGCRWLTYNPDLEELYLTTFLTAHFIVVRLRTGEVKDLGRISQYDFMGPCYSACGYVFTTDCFGYILRYDPRKETIERLSVKVPAPPWRNSDGNGVFQLIQGPDKVKLYGAGLLGQSVFEYDPTAGPHGRIRDYGTLCGEDRWEGYSVDCPLPRTISMGHDGKIYAASRKYCGGVPGTHIFSVDIATGEKRDFGQMQVPGVPHIGVAVASTVGLNGDVYFCPEQPRDSALPVIIFNPAGVRLPHPKPTPSEGPNVRMATSDPHPYRYYYPSRDRNTAFVTRGTVYARELGQAGRTPYIPRNECAVTALTVGANGALFGATSGARSHFFTCMPLTRRVVPLNTFGDGPTTCRAMLTAGDGNVYFGAMGSDPARPEGHLYMYDTARGAAEFGVLDDRDKGEFTVLFRPPSPEIATLTDLGVVAPGEGIYAMAFDATRGRIHGLTWPGGKFFTCDLATRKIVVDDIFGDFIVKRNHISRAMAVAGGKVWFSGVYGILIAYDPETGRFRKTSMVAPVGAGKEYLSVISAMTVSDGVVYGGTFADGYLFTFDPIAERLVNLGKPSIESHIRAVAVGNDGIVWALSGAQDELTHLVRYDPARRDMSDLGLLRAKQPKTWIVHKADAMITGPDGEIVIGESDALSHLIIYHPPVEKRTPCA